MKPLLRWMKANLIIVLCAAAAIIVLPTLLFLSSSSHAKLRASLQEQMNNDWRDVNRASVVFEAPAANPAEPGIKFERPPNQATIERFRDYFKRLHARTQELVNAATERNRRGMSVFIEGLFPEPDPNRRTMLREEANQAWLAAHAELLANAVAGAPPDPAEVFQDLRGRRESAISRLVGQDADDEAALTEEQLAEVRQMLTARRQALYRDRATDLTFYATPDVFQDVNPWTQLELPDIETIWDWQRRLWVHRAVIDALVLANIDLNTHTRLTELTAPVKRVESITTPPWDLHGVSTQPVGDSFAAMIPPDYSASITGRAGFPVRTNPLYDIAYAKVTLIVSSRLLPAVIAAFPEANFMSVIDLDIEEVDRSSHERLGYDYGSDHVVRATLLVETLWLRSWTTKLMPPSVRKALGAPEPPAPADASENPNAT